MPMTAGKVTLFMGPNTLGAPDDLEAAIIDFIDRAQKELLVAIQEVDHRPIADAFIRARKRGVFVRMVMEQDYLREKKPPQPDSTGSYETNRDLLVRMLRQGIDAKADYNGGIFHQKFMVRDNFDVLTGSTNFTTTGVTKNLNHVAVIADPKVTKEYRGEFSEIRKGIFGKRSLVHGGKPLEDHVVANLRIKPLFAPDHMPETEFIKQMIKAKSRIDFAIFTFAESSGIDDSLVNAKSKGLAVRGALDRKSLNQTWAARHGLQAQGVELFKNKTGTGVRKIHHKLMVIDDRLTIIGSFNYTGPANLVNDENIVVLGDLDSSDPAEIAAGEALAHYARQEIDRIIQDQCEPL